MKLIGRTLENLSKLLNLLVDVNVEPKHFKNGKFNSTEDNTVVIFWTLLNKLSSNNACNVVDNVKLLLHSYQYKSIQFYCLPRDMSEGSRKLLLAFGFLINKGILHKYVQETIYKVPELKIYKNCSSQFNIDSRCAKSNSSKWKTIQWAKGKLNSNKRIIEETSIAIRKLVQELNDGVSKTMGNLSLYELLALGNKSYARNFDYEIDIKISILECYEKFVRMERIFWDWMNTVRATELENSSEFSYEELSKFCSLVDNKKSLSNVFW